MATTSENEMAEQYCKLISDEITGLEELLTEWHLVELFDETNPTDFLSQLSATEMLVELAEGAGESAGDYVPSMTDYLNLNCLEVILLGRRSLHLGEWETTGVELVRTIGGPNAYVIVEDGGLRVEVYWGNQRAKMNLHCPSIIRQLAELFDIQISSQE